MRKVLMIGNDSSVKGGITSVITQMLNYDWKSKDVQMNFIPSYKGGGTIYKSLYFGYAFCKIVITSLIKKPDLVHMHMSYKGSFSRKNILMKWFEFREIPVIIHLHGSEFEKWFNSVSHKKQEQIKKMLKRCKYMVVLGEKWNSTIKKIEPECNTIVVENAICIPQYTARWKDEECRLLFMGVLIKRKGVQDLIKAAKLVKKKDAEINVHYEIAGTGEEEKFLKELVKKNNLEEYFEFSGWIDGQKKEECYKRATVMVLPSYNEGLPIAILEAISYGLPVIATDVGDISAAVHDGKNGYLVAPGDINGLADAIIRICDKNSYREFSDYSKKLAREKFDENKFFDIFSKIYHEI